MEQSSSALSRRREGSPTSPSGLSAGPKLPLQQSSRTSRRTQLAEADEQLAADGRAHQVRDVGEPRLAPRNLAADEDQRTHAAPNMLLRRTREHGVCGDNLAERASARANHLPFQ